MGEREGFHPEGDRVLPCQEMSDKDGDETSICAPEKSESSGPPRRTKACRRREADCPTNEGPTQKISDGLEEGSRTGPPNQQTTGDGGASRAKKVEGQTGQVPKRKEG